MLPRVDVRSFYAADYDVFARFFLIAGLLVKPAFVQRIALLTPGRLIIADVAINVAGLLAQSLAIPAAMVFCFSFTDLILQPLFGTDESAPVTWLSIAWVTT